MYLWVYANVCVFDMRVYKCVQVHSPDQAHVEARGRCGISAAITSPLNVLGQGLSVNLELTVSDRLAGHQAPRTHLSPPLLSAGVTGMVIKVGAGDPNSGPCA